jgi:putative radical SAM enzyme (TIGR03279 family)
MPVKGLVVTEVYPNSIAEELEITPGATIIEINGKPVNDLLDYRFLTSDEELEMKMITADGEEWLMEIEKDFEEDLGLGFGTNALGKIRRCRNKCLFCFVDQEAPNMRETLYVKDDDYRHSFLHGNFVTLTNVNNEELQRIIEQRLSPLYVSVHTTNPELRPKMMRNPHSANIMKQLTALAGAGIELHTQVVLCPGINDGAELDRTIQDLANLWPNVRSLAVVPVGLTKYREGLAELRLFTKKEAGRVVKQVARWQQQFINQFEDSFVFIADEFYVISEEPVPLDEHYGDYPQLENGIGLIRLFIDEWEELKPKLPNQITRRQKVTVITGASAHSIIESVVERLNQIDGLEVQFYVIPNRHFGETVTVAGLLTGSDLLQELAGKDLGQKLIIPAVMLKDQVDDVFLDDMTMNELVEKLGVPIIPVDTPTELVNTLVTV